MSSAHDPQGSPTPPSGASPESTASERSVMDILADIKRGAIAGRSLSADLRVRCVEYLAAEGVSVPEIAQLLDRNERTIRRDLDRVREANALVVDEGFAPRLAGEMLVEYRASVARIRRTTRERDCPAAVRIEGERAASEIMDRTLARLQSLGFLPMAARGIRAEVTHRLGGATPVENLALEARRLLALGPAEPGSTLAVIEAAAIDLDAVDGGAPAERTGDGEVGS